MDVRSQHYSSLRYREHGATLQFRLTALIVLAVVIVLSVGMFVDYHRMSRQYIDATLASLEEQARALMAARSRIKGPADFSSFVDDFCAQMNVHISPGHHILILDETGAVAIRSRHHSGAEVEDALLSGNPQDPILSVGKHRLAQVRLKDKNGTTIVLAQYLDHMERNLRAQLISRCLTTAITALAIILLIYLVVKVWVIIPVNSLANAARQWATRDFSARSEPIGPAGFRFLSHEFNSMAEQLERHKNDLIAELEQARHIQTNLLPVKQPAVSGLCIATDYKPARHVAGDLYDIFNIAQNRTCIAIMDVCGHGISSALLTGVVKMSLRHRLSEKDDLSEAIRSVNDDLLACTPEGHFVTACVGIWDHQAQSWTYCAAGHPGGLLLTQNHPESLESTAALLGVLTETEWPTNTISLSPGNKIFLYTDGVVESGLAEGEIEGYNLKKVLNNCVDLDLNEQVETIMAGTIRHGGGRTKDDATIVAFEVLPQHALRSLSPVGD